MHTVFFETRNHKIETETKYIAFLARRHASKSQIMIILTNPIDWICVVLICFHRNLYEIAFFYRPCFISSNITKQQPFHAFKIQGLKSQRS